MLAPRRVATLGGVSCVLLASVAVGSFKLGYARGSAATPESASTVEQEAYWNGLALGQASQGLVDGLHSSEALLALEHGSRSRAVHLLDLMVDAGIASFSIRREVAEQVGVQPTETQEALYRRLVLFRMEHPSTLGSEARAISSRVAQAVLEFEAPR